MWVVPLRRVFPWWYLGGFVATIALILSVGSENMSAIGAFWGPLIGLEIQQRQQRAAKRLEDGLLVDRRSLEGASWIEPVCTAMFTALGAGVSLVIGFFLERFSTAQLWTGLALLLCGGVALIILVLWARRRNVAQLAQRDHSDGAEDHEHVPDALTAHDAGGVPSQSRETKG